MKYIFRNKKKIKEADAITKKIYSKYIYANKRDVECKELVIEEKPEYDEETQELYSWFENGEVITQKFKVIDKEG